jgi:hypothetical protein
MDAALGPPAEDVTRLRSYLNDLVSVVALPALWAGSEPPQIVSTLLDALVGTLRAEFVFVRLTNPEGGGPFIVMVRVVESLKRLAREREITEAIDSSLGDAPLKWPAHARVLVDNLDLSVASAHLGLHGEIGGVIAGSQRRDFPVQTERLSLDVAANQAAIGLQQARLLSEQRRVAQELDERVAQRIGELARANENTARTRAHFALARGQHSSDTIVQ